MHPCLRVDEIVRFIASELVASEGQRTSVALACCRKSFEDPVLDVLWEYQRNLLPLFKSLPGDVWVWNGQGRTVSVPMTHFYLSQPLALKDFQETPDGAGMGSFPGVRWENAISRRTHPSGSPIPGGILGPATLRHQQTVVSESKGPPVVARQCGVHPIHPLVHFS